MNNKPYCMYILHIKPLRRAVTLLCVVHSLLGFGQSSWVHEVKTGFVVTSEISNVGLFYELIPRANFGYEIGVINDKQFLYIPCFGHCSDPAQSFKLYDWKTWTFTLALKYYFSRKKDHARFYLGSFLLYAFEVPGSINDEFRERLKKTDPISFYPIVATNRLSPGGILGYKMRFGAHLSIEPSLGVGINVNAPYGGTELESFFAGKIAWRF